MNTPTLTPATLGVLDNLQGGPQAAQGASQYLCGDQHQQTAPAARSAAQSLPMPEPWQRLRETAPSSKDILSAQSMENFRKGEEAALEKEKVKRGISNDGPHGGPRQLVSRSLNTVQMRAIDWLWTGWIPKGYITIWAGETGAGKSTVLADVTARVTTGAPWPGEPLNAKREPGRVLWLGSEDGIEELTVPRLVACGANLANVLEIQGVVQQGKRNTFSMQDDLASVSALLNEARASGYPVSMLVIDPVTSYLPGQKLRKVDLNDAGQLRTVLEPWLTLAQEHNLAIVCVTHFMKDTTRAMLHRVLGSAAFTQTCRSLCSVVARPDEGPYAKALIQVKVNLPEHPGGAWKFSTVKVQVGIDQRSAKPIDATRADWEELDPSLTPESLVGGTRGPVSKTPAAFGLWLRSYFMTTPLGQGQLVAGVKSAAISSGVVTESWFDKNSAEYLEKQNEGGLWLCRPRTA